MRLLGLTGGIGMGKSTVSALLHSHGWEVADTDLIARELVEPGQPALAEIRSAFGGEYLNASGGLQRRALGELVFSDDAARRRLEEILHPRIRESWQSRVALWRRNGVRAGVVVIPLLFETDAAGAFEATVCVACSAMTQRLRLLDRGWSVAEIARRNGAQMDVADKMSLATHVIWSEGDKGVLNGQVRRLTERWAR